MEPGEIDRLASIPPPAGVRMPTIVAVCPYCRVGGVRAPSSAVGASATCPKCGSSFTVMPSEGAPGWSSGPSPQAQQAPPAPQPPPPPQAAPQPTARIGPPAVVASPPRPTEETRPSSAVSDDTDADVAPKKRKKKRRKPKEEEPAAEAAPSPAPSPAPAPAPSPAPAASETEEEEELEPTDVGLVVALSSLALVGAVVLSTLLPFGRFIAAGLAGLGLLGGLSTLGAEGRARLVGAAAAGVHFLLLVVIVLLPSWLNLDPWKAGIIEDAPPAPVAFGHGSEHKTEMVQWVDAANASWQFQDVRVTILAPTLGPVELIGPKGAKRMSKELCMQIGIRIENVGVTRGIPLSGWAAANVPEQAQVTDSTGKMLKPASFDENWWPDLPAHKGSDVLFPGKSVERKMIFTAPTGRFDYVRLVLPGEPFGFKEEQIKFQINGGSFIRTAQIKK